MISACEQSKQFIQPKIGQATKLEDLNFPKDSKLICFDEHGSKIESINKSIPISILVGPEGGFLDEEKSLLKKSGFNFYRLTPTILRAQEAVAVGLGIVRSI